MTDETLLDLLPTPPAGTYWAVEPWFDTNVRLLLRRDDPADLLTRIATLGATETITVTIDSESSLQPRRREIRDAAVTILKRIEDEAKLARDVRQFAGEYRKPTR